jgi:hypothetical protein
VTTSKPSAPPAKPESPALRPDPQQPAPSSLAPTPESPIQTLLRLTENAAFLRTKDGRFYAQVSTVSRREIFALDSKAFRDWLIDGFFSARGEIPSDWSLRRILMAAEASARFEGGTPSVFIRVGRGGNTDSNSSSSNGNSEGTDNGDQAAILPCYLDLANPDGQAVQIGPDGWSIISNPPVHFRRPDGHLALPVPARGGSLDLLRPYVNLADRDFRLLIVWMAAALRPVGPYPVLALYGQHGSAKSTLARVVRALVDPQAAPLLAEPRNSRDLLVAAASGWLLALDNMRAIPPWISDALCLLATGGALAAHVPFSTGERSLIHAQRPVVLNGIEEFIVRADLVDRSIIVDLPPIPPSKRLCEDEFWRAFQADYPRILGALLDAVSGGLRELPGVRPAELPRMADFARFAEAVGRGLGWPANTALDAYLDNRRVATASQLDESPLAAFLLDLGPEYLFDYVGSMSDLLPDLTMLAQEKADSPCWPKTPQLLSRELRRLAPHLANHGLFVSFSRRNAGRVVRIARDPIVAHRILVPDVPPIEE